MSTEISQFHEKNFPKGFESYGPVCPFFDLLVICGRFAGLKEEDLQTKYFCGTNDRDYSDIDILSGSEGVIRTAYTTCRNIYKMWKPQMEFINRPTQLVSKDRTLEKIRATDDITEIANIAHNHVTSESQLSEQMKLMNEWRQIVFEIGVQPSEDNQDIPHFRKVEKPEDLANDEVLDYVTSFYNQLRHLLGIKDEQKGVFTFNQIAAENCPQSPVSETIRTRFS